MTDPKLTQLLMKARKGATAGFNVKQAISVLEACGFKVEKRFEGRQLDALTVTAPDGRRYGFNKRLDCRMLFGSELFWEKTLAAKVKVVASEKLGLPTYEQEQADKKRYGAKVDIKNTGTCAFCFGVFKTEATGEMVHHGYQRPGDGETHGKCPGEAYAPFEKSVAGTTELLRIVEFRVETLRRMLNDLKAEPETFTSLDGREHSKGDPLYGQALHAATERAKVGLRDQETYRNAIKAVVLAWVPDELPEVRFPKRQPLKLAALINNGVGNV